MMNALVALLLAASATALTLNSSSVVTDLSGSVRQDSGCASFCNFRLCVIGNSGDFIPLPVGFGLTFPPAFTAQPPFICRTDGAIIGRVLRTRPAMVRIRSGRFIRIARLGRNSLDARFNPNFYRAQEFTLPEFFGLSAVRRSKFRSSSQRRVLENRCTFLPIRTWEIMRGDGTVARVVSSNARENCVSFLSTVQTTQIKIIMRWDTAVDIDLTLTEPGGFVLDFSNPVSPSGGFLFEDIQLGECDINSGARESVEMIEYSGLGFPADGSYTINLSQFASCEGLSTNWQLSVIIGDTTVLDRSGTVAPLADDAEAVLFETAEFTFPDGNVIRRGEVFEAPVTEGEL